MRTGGEPIVPGNPGGRKIVHIDMDAFFASVEQRDDPSLRGRPVAVGGMNRRGVVAAASYEARKFGVHSAMPAFKAAQACPDLVFVPPRFEVYRSVSAQIRAIFLDYTPLVEPLSLDEAYLDVTDNLKGIPYATTIAKDIRRRIFETTSLTASAGVSFCKFLAKMASDQRKPNGMFVITPADALDFVSALKVKKFHGVGPATAAKMEALGIITGADLRAQPLDLLQRHFGKAGAHFHSISRGIDNRLVQPNRVRKSIGAEDTFMQDLRLYDDLAPEIVPLVEKVWNACQRLDSHGRTATLKIKFSDFTQITRSRTLGHAIGDRDTLEFTILDLLRAELPPKMGIRLLGVTVSSLDGETETETEDNGQLVLPF